MSESYAGPSKADMLEVLDQEKGMALAETLTDASERIAASEKVSGPAADRYRAAAAEFSNRYAGTYLGKRELRALVANPRLQVYEDPKAFLTCNHDAFTALCNPDRGRGRDAIRVTPDHSRCHPACANISRTDSQIAALRREVARIDAEAEAADQGQRLGGPVAGPDRPGLHRPRTKIVGDITYLPTAEDWLYLASWLDLATRELIGYSMADHHRAELVVDALDGRRAGPPGTGMRDPQRLRIGIHLRSTPHQRRRVEAPAKHGPDR
jgi:hypothetical protein